MKIVTAANKSYEWILNLSIKNNAKVGYDSLVYNLDNSLSYGKPFSTQKYFLDIEKQKKHGKSPYKVDILIDAFNELPNDSCFIWLDADAFAISRLDEIENAQDFDLGVTLRRIDERKSLEYNKSHTEWSGYVNAGVLFIKKTEAMLRFLHRWNQEIATSQFNSDQHALNRILLQHSSLETHGDILNIDGTRVKIFSTLDYNWYYWPKDPPSTAKILHLKEHKKKPECVNKWGNWTS